MIKKKILKSGRWEKRKMWKKKKPSKKEEGRICFSGWQELLELPFCRRRGWWAQLLRSFVQSYCLWWLPSGHQPSQVWALLWGVEQQPRAVIEAPVARSLTKCQVLCLSQSLIWAITFCLLTSHSSFLWRHFKAWLLFAEPQGIPKPPHTLLRSWCPTERKANPVPAGYQLCCHWCWAPSQKCPRSNLFSIQTGK